MAAAGWLIVFLALQAFIAFAWWRFLRARSTELTTAEALLCTGVLYFAQIVGISLLLGWVGELKHGPLLICTLLCSAVILMVARRLPLPSNEPDDDRHRKDTRRRIHGLAGDGGRNGSGMLLGLNLTLLVLFTVVMVWIGLRGASSASFGTDGLKYHLPMSALMLQTHQVALGPVHNPTIAAYPKDIEIWFHWILSFFRHDRWVDLAQVPFLWLAMVATYCISRCLGSSHASSVAGMLLLPFSPVVLTQVTTAYTDVALAALLLAGVALLLVARRSEHAAVSASCGCAVGLLLGTKFTGVKFALLLLGAFAFVLVRTRRRNRATAIALACGLAVLLGGDTYVRNWRLHGNPVFPYRTSVLGMQLAGPWDAGRVYGAAQTKDIHPIRRLVRSWRAVDVVSHSDIMGGFGVTWPFLAVVSAVSLVVSVRTRDTVRLGVFLLFSLFFLATPLNFRVRFVIYLLGLGCVCFSHLLDRTGRAARGLLMTSAVVVVLFTTHQFARREIKSLRRAGGSDACARAEPASFLDAYQWLRHNAHAGSSVVVLPSSEELFAYCLWNPSFSNRVEFAQATTRADLLALATRRPDTILLLPHSAATYAWYAAEPPSQRRELFSNEHVTLATIGE